MADFGRWSANGGDPSLNEIGRTDRFLDALATGQPAYSTDAGEAELAHLLAGWRDEVREPRLSAPVTVSEAALALRAGAVSRKRTRTSLAIVGSAAAAVLCLGGFGAVVAGAGPGDALYGLRGMLFGEQQHTRDDQVALAAQQQMTEVRQLIDQGQWQAAQDKLQTVTTAVATVDDVERKQQLTAQWQELSVKVQTQDANATLPPGAPPATLPQVTVPGDLSSSSSDSPTTTPPTVSASSPTESSQPLPTSGSASPSTTLPSTTPPSPSPTSAAPSPSTPPSTTTPPATVSTTPSAPASSRPPVTTTNLSAVNSPVVSTTAAAGASTASTSAPGATPPVSSTPATQSASAVESTRQRGPQSSAAVSSPATTTTVAGSPALEGRG